MLGIPVVVITCMIIAAGSDRRQASGGAPEPYDILAYFPEAGNDASRISWSHATNSRRALKAALDGSVQMLEADVLLRSDGTPVMAHPPANDSDLTFVDFVSGVAAARRLVGVKLDFKDEAAVEPCLLELRSRPPLPGPLVINADVLQGPEAAPLPRIDGPRLLRLWQRLAPGALLSVGWTTRAAGAYDLPQAEALRRLLLPLPADVVAGRLTLPVRASLLAGRSRETLRDLCRQFAASLTVWGAATDTPIEAELLQWYRQQLGPSRVFVDLPQAPVMNDRL